MGGTVAETIRRKNGEVIKMARKTGAYNWMFFSREFNEGKIDQAIDDHIKVFLEMKEDYASGEPYDHAMSPVYGWCNQVAPVDYGLVVIDFQNKKIHSMQGYDTPGEKFIINFAPTYGTDEETLSIYKFLAKNNLLNVRDDEGNALGSVHEIFGSVDTFEKISEAVKNSFASRHEFSLKIDGRNITSRQIYFVPAMLNDFEIIKYEESLDGLLSMAKSLKAEGFNFNEVEVEMWKEYYEDFNEYAFNDMDEEKFEDLSDDEHDKIVDEFKSKFLENLGAALTGKDLSKEASIKNKRI